MSHNDEYPAHEHNTSDYLAEHFLYNSEEGTHTRQYMFNPLNIIYGIVAHLFCMILFICVFYIM